MPVPVASVTSTGSHQTVLLREAVTALMTNSDNALEADGIYVDATFGRGGHSRAIMKCLDGAGKLIAVDKDPQAIEYARDTFGGDDRFTVCHSGFSELLNELPMLLKGDVLGSVSGVLLDLGVSSPQLDQAERGFSFMHDGPLDMRMNSSAGISAKEWIASASAEEMTKVFKEFGEERYAKRIAGAIEREREIKEIKTTLHLARVVSEAHPAWEKHKHPATRVFQAIRIFINHELEELQIFLEQILDLLKTGGRLVVISFHSLEDRLVKNFIRDHVRGFTAEERISVRLPIAQPTHVRLKSLGKAVRASVKEVNENPRSRSAIMRMAEKVA